MVTLNNVKVTGAGTPGTLFGTANTSNDYSFVVDPSTSSSISFYYWPSSYSVANQNLANTKIPSGYVNMTGFLSSYQNSNIPQFSPLSITPSAGPPLYWQPAVVREQLGRRYRLLLDKLRYAGRHAGRRQQQRRHVR